MEKKEKPEGLLKLSDLVRATGESSSTIKYYVSIGLVSIAKKTSANMAYYDKSAIDRIKLIRKLQKQRFYPLSYIQSILAIYSTDDIDLDLVDAIFKYNPNHKRELTSLKKAVRITGLTQEQILKLSECGIIQIQDGQIREDDMDILSLVHQRLMAGLSFSHTLKAFSVYQEHLRQAVDSDIDSMILDSFFTQNLTSEQMVRMIRLSDRSLTEFIEIKREQMNMKSGSAKLMMTADISKSLERIIIEHLLPKAPKATLPDCVQALIKEGSKCTITMAVRLVRDVYDYCRALGDKPENFDDQMYLEYGISYAFFSITPEKLFSENELKRARINFPDAESLGDLRRIG